MTISLEYGVPKGMEVSTFGRGVNTSYLVVQVHQFNFMVAYYLIPQENHGIITASSH